MHGVSAVGYRHLREGTGCQDAHGMLRTREGLVLAVADGAGSAPHSASGSRWAVELALEAFAPVATDWARLPDPRERKARLTDSFGEVRERFLERCGGAPAPYETTLTVVVVADGWLGHLSVGDGLVVVRTTGSAGPAHHLLPRPPARSEYANETVFLGSPSALAQSRADCVRDAGVDGVLLSTDGMTNALLKHSPAGPPLPHDAFVGHLFQRLGRDGYEQDDEDRHLREFLASDQISKVTGDDKTLLWAIRT
ncbi:PP2C family serine/threonine-protein phosphatase [Streptomyces xanthii]|uniref:PP2C family serine/threonine-protein phosphatase n=1 Tax=Streptomyces xanthii TaxID=2768069 RepID=UPI001CB78D04|nr:PP2C family serine/threonine-protein phosphatase [Streptomyces xanthii]